jgi:hypothetical protein
MADKNRFAKATIVRDTIGLIHTQQGRFLRKLQKHELAAFLHLPAVDNHKHRSNETRFIVVNDEMCLIQKVKQAYRYFEEQSQRRIKRETKKRLQLSKPPRPPPLPAVVSTSSSTETLNESRLNPQRKKTSLPMSRKLQGTSKLHAPSFAVANQVRPASPPLAAQGGSSQRLPATMMQSSMNSVSPIDLSALAQRLNNIHSVHTDTLVHPPTIAQQATFSQRLAPLMQSSMNSVSPIDLSALAQRLNIIHSMPTGTLVHPPLAQQMASSQRLPVPMTQSSMNSVSPIDLSALAQRFLNNIHSRPATTCTPVHQNQFGLSLQASDLMPLLLSSYVAPPGSLGAALPDVNANTTLNIQQHVDHTLYEAIGRAMVEAASAPHDTMIEELLHLMRASVSTSTSSVVQATPVAVHPPTTAAIHQQDQILQLLKRNLQQFRHLHPSSF